ncbi:MAG: HEAT repeat domain-containing protein [Anaerolineaceae bacterium]|nr:HEAT repeat domain-containing protein [Anaerolineaceae bacterium]
MKWFNLGSFVLGFIASSLAWFSYIKVKARLPEIKKILTQNSDTSEKEQIRGIDRLLRSEIYRHAQHQHLAEGIFPLKEILVPTRVLIYPFNEDYIHGDPPIADQMIPYLPDWPQFSSAYNLRSIPAFEMFNSAHNIALIGEMGSGKSVCLADLTSQIILRYTQKSDKPRHLPLLVHAYDLEMKDTQKDPMGTVYQAVAARFPRILKNSIMRYLRQLERHNRIVLLLDGLDELPPADFAQACEFLKHVDQAHPRMKIVCAASPQYLDGLIQNRFVPMTLKAWSRDEQRQLYELWRNKWDFSLLAESEEEQQTIISLITSWMDNDQQLLTPLEATFRIWAALSGDAIGQSQAAGMEAFFRRLTEFDVSHSAIESLAFMFFTRKSKTLSQSTIETILLKHQVGFKPAGKARRELELSEEHAQTIEGARKRGETGGMSVMSHLVNHGFLRVHTNGEYSFCHPLILAYFAGFAALKNQSPDLDELLNWPVGSMVMGFSATLQKEPLWIDKLLITEENDVMYRQALCAARWLKYIPKDTPWRTAAYRSLFNVVQNINVPSTIRFRIIAAFLSSNDPALIEFFKKLLTSKSADIRQMAALGLGAIGDPAVLDYLINQLEDPSEFVGYAAAVALQGVQSPAVVKRLSEILRSSIDETARRIAAEGLANIQPDGHDMLSELVHSEDILTRRACIYGLGTINEDWSRDLIEHVALDDGEWIIRNTASHTLQLMRGAHYFVPRALPHYTKADWLLEYAASIGQGISPEIEPIDILLDALRSDLPENQWNALNYLRDIRDKSVLLETLKVFFNRKSSLGTIRAADYNLWLQSVSGVSLPRRAK